MSDFPLTKECFVTSVTLSAIRKFGLESLDWEPEILRDAFAEEFEMNKVPQKLFDKLNCGYMLIGTDAFTSSIEGFLSATNIMNNLVFSEDEAPYCSLEMCAWSIWEAINLLGDIENGAPTCKFCSDIVAYIREVGRLNGVSQFPKWMSFANPENMRMPDTTDDPDVFATYMNRQNDYISDLNGFVTFKQDLLTKELHTLQNAGLIG